MIARSRVTITLPAILREQAQIVAAERGDSVSDVVRLALQQYLEKTRKEREGLTALYAEFADEDRQLAEAGRGGTPMPRRPLPEERIEPKRFSRPDPSLSLLSPRARNQGRRKRTYHNL